MFSEELKAFKERHKIKSADEWANISGVSKSTIVRALKGDGKDMGINTLLEMIEPYGETIDQVLNMGEYAPDVVRKNELTEKIESVIDELENSPMIPDEPAEEIMETLVEAQKFINEPNVQHKECPACSVLRELIAMQKDELEAKNTWIKNSFKICLILLLIIFVMTIIDGALIASLISFAKG